MPLKLVPSTEDSSFYDRVGVLAPDELDGLPIQPSLPPYFVADQVPALLAFVRDNPTYHIVSILPFQKLPDNGEGYVTMNRFIASAQHWRLACGDADPELCRVKVLKSPDSLSEVNGARSGAKRL